MEFDVKCRVTTGMHYDCHPVKLLTRNKTLRRSAENYVNDRSTDAHDAWIDKYGRPHRSYREYGYHTDLYISKSAIELGKLKIRMENSCDLECSDRNIFEEPEYQR